MCLHTDVAQSYMLHAAVASPGTLQVWRLAHTLTDLGLEKDIDHIYEVDRLSTCIARVHRLLCYVDHLSGSSGSGNRLGVHVLPLFEERFTEPPIGPFAASPQKPLLRSFCSTVQRRRSFLDANFVRSPSVLVYAPPRLAPSAQQRKQVFPRSAVPVPPLQQHWAHRGPQLRAMWRERRYPQRGAVPRRNSVVHMGLDRGWAYRIGACATGRNRPEKGVFWINSSGGGCYKWYRVWVVGTFLFPSNRGTRPREGRTRFSTRHGAKPLSSLLPLSLSTVHSCTAYIILRMPLPMVWRC